MRVLILHKMTITTIPFLSMVHTTVHMVEMEIVKLMFKKAVIKEQWHYMGESEDPIWSFHWKGPQ
jgi:hypothetical protein